MTTETGAPTHAKGKSWFLIIGVLTLLAGAVALVCPFVTTVVIAQFIGWVALISGIFLLFSALFGKARNHRSLDLASAILRILVGILLVANVIHAVLALTLVVAAVFIAEGVLGGMLAFRLRGKNPAWGWVLTNAIAALILGGLLLAKWPGDSAWAIGLLFGINCIFIGVSMIMYGIHLPRAQEA